MKYFDLDGKKSYFDIAKYAISKRPALMVCDKVMDDGYFISVNLLDDDEKPIIPEDCIAFDINNVEPEVYVRLRQLGFIEDTGDIEFSGFCAYPVCRLNLEKIKEYSDETVAR